MELAPATHLNVILPRLLQELRNDGWNVVEHSAASTAAGRRVCSVEKSHHADAALTGCPNALRYMPEEPIVIEAKGRGTYQRIMPDKNGTPRGETFRHYTKLPKHLQSTTPTPGHKKRAKRVDGIATGDYVGFTHRNTGQTIRCYGTISNRRVARTKPTWKSARAAEARVVERGHGYEIHYPRQFVQRP